MGLAVLQPNCIREDTVHALLHPIHLIMLSSRTVHTTVSLTNYNTPGNNSWFSRVPMMAHAVGLAFQLAWTIWGVPEGTRGDLWILDGRLYRLPGYACLTYHERSPVEPLTCIWNHWRRFPQGMYIYLHSSHDSRYLTRPLQLQKYSIWQDHSEICNLH